MKDLLDLLHWVKLGPFSELFVNFLEVFQIAKGNDDAK